MHKILVDLCFIVKNIIPILLHTKEKQIAKILTEKKLKISFAESCTGGLLSSRMTDLSGSSNYIMQNFVTYANKAKVNLLDVNNETIKQYGVVSEQVATEMANGLLDKNECDVAVSITGIAGPTGGSKQKPVGLAFACIMDKNNCKTFEIRKNKKLSRYFMKYAFSDDVLQNLELFIKNNSKLF